MRSERIKSIVRTSRVSRRGRSPDAKVLLVIVATVGVIVVLLLLGVVPKLMDKKILNVKENEASSAVPVVHTVLVQKAPFSETASLPGNIGAMQYATIYARVDGYLKSRMVDIGDHVKEGQLLAEIDTPTIDEEIAQSVADLQQAKAQLVSSKAKWKQAKAQSDYAEAQIKKSQADQSYATVTADRWGSMASRGAVSLQSRDEKNRALESQNASLEAARSQKQAADEAVAEAASEINVTQAGVAAKMATLNKFKAQQSFKYVRAPFAGVITSRKVDPGSLITAGSQSQSLELFQLAKLGLLRIYVNVPQSISRYLQAKQKAKLTVASYPERTFDGEITNVSGALDPQTRTRQTEIKIDNKDGALIPGMYAQVKLTVQRAEPWVTVPSNAVISRNNDLEVAVVRDGKARYQKVVLGRDFGDTIEIKAGLAEKEYVIVNPPDDLRDGDAVQSSSEVALDSAK